MIKRSNKKLICAKITDKKVVWLPDLNKYLLVIPPLDQIIQKLYQEESDRLILDYCVGNMGITMDEAIQLLIQIKINLNEIKKAENSFQRTPSHYLKNLPTVFGCSRYYRINELLFFIEFETTELEYLVHPKLAHLEIAPSTEFVHHFQLFQIDSEINLVVNGVMLQSWSREMDHFMTGKVSMEILQKITQTEEKDWMAVFHAAGISNGIDGILFLGDSGNGKSTLSAILMANEYEVLADDFLPVESKTALLCSFPAAISVKKHAVELLAAQFPELKMAKEYQYPVFDKTVRYLSKPSAVGNPKKVSCKALVFVKYEANSGLLITKLPKDIAFQKLVPNSWISPLEINAKRFLEWFGKLPCWQLTYSDNQAMLETVKKIFDDEL